MRVASMAWRSMQNIEKYQTFISKEEAEKIEEKKTEGKEENEAEEEQKAAQINRDSIEKSENYMRTGIGMEEKKEKEMPYPGTAQNFKMSCSLPDDSTGQLAAMLARAETKMELQDVSSKAIRALNSLKMASAFAEGDDAKKVAQMIRRMEKLINRIHKKQQHLNKEEVLENQRKAAERRKEAEKASELEKELRGKRNKRRRDERQYANKELAEDQKMANQEMYANLAGAGASASAAAAPAAADISSALAADVSAAEGASFDVVV